MEQTKKTRIWVVCYLDGSVVRPYLEHPVLIIKGVPESHSKADVVRWLEESGRCYCDSCVPWLNYEVKPIAEATSYVKGKYRIGKIHTIEWKELEPIEKTEEIPAEKKMKNQNQQGRTWVIYHHIANVVTPNPKLVVKNVPHHYDRRKLMMWLEEVGYFFSNFGVPWGNHCVVEISKSPPYVRGKYRAGEIPSIEWRELEPIE